MRTHTRVLLLIPHLDGGGAAQVTRMLAERLSPDRFEVHLGVITGARATVSSLSAHIVMHFPHTRRVRNSLPAIWRLVRRIRPDAILSGMAHLNFAVLMLRPLLPHATRVLVRQNGEPGKSDAGWMTPALYRLLYPRADAVICQTQAMANAVARATRTAANIHVLPNPVDVHARCSQAGESSLWRGSGPHLLAVGRLAPEKGYDLLLSAMASLRCEFPHADLTILGSGREETHLRAQARELTLERSVLFAGRVLDPEAWFPGATLFVLSSLREGMPNALLEAAAAGMPIVTTPALGGLRELLSGKPGVWIADQVSALALERAIVCALSALEPGQRFPHSWIEEYQAERAVPRFEALIDSVLAAAQ
jgi:glycosyltransferase involved in cell wall biosynthesis